MVFEYREGNLSNPQKCNRFLRSYHSPAFWAEGIKFTFIKFHHSSLVTVRSPDGLEDNPVAVQAAGIRWCFQGALAHDTGIKR